MSPRLKRVLKWVGYPLFYLMALLISVPLTFPYDSLRDRIMAEFNARQTGGEPMRLQIGEMSSYWLSGVEAENVKLVQPPPPPAKPDEKPGKPREMVFDELHARASITRLLVGTLHVTFGGNAMGGEIDGYTSDADNARTIFAELENVDVGQAPYLRDAVGLPMTGALSGTIDLRLPEGKLSMADGRIELKVTDLTIGDGKAKIRDTIALPKLNAGELTLEAEATEGRVKINKLTAKGPDIEVVADGRIRLREPLGSSITEMSLRFKFSDRYKTKNELTRGLFGAPDSKMPGLFDLDPKNKRAKRPDGFYAWRVLGPFSNLSMTPAAGTATRGGASRRTRGFSTTPKK